MKIIKDVKELSVIFKDYMKKSKLTGHGLAVFLGKDPAYISRILNNKIEISADMMFKLLNHLGYEVVIMTKKERNLLERGAYAELAKEMEGLREEIRKGVVNEIEHDLIKNLTEYFRQKSKLEKHRERD